jgi:hypothetical protein
VAAEGGWQRKFDDPIILPNGTRLDTLREAIAYLAKAVPHRNAECLRSPRRPDADLRGRKAGRGLDDLRAHGYTSGHSPERGSGVQSRSEGSPLGAPEAEKRPAMTVWIYVDTGKQVGDRNHLKVFANEDAAETWLQENDPEGVAFEYEVLE